MKAIYLFLPMVLFLTSCLGKTEETNSIFKVPNFEPTYRDKIEISLKDIDPDSFLDSSYYSLWTDNFVPYKTKEFGRLYSAHPYTLQPSVNNFQVIGLYVNADDWFKINLITIDSGLNLVDEIEVANSVSYLIEEAGDAQVVEQIEKYTIMQSANQYLNISLNSNLVINYYTDSTTIEKDSITTKIIIGDNGRFKLTTLDSIHTFKKLRNQY